MSSLQNNKKKPKLASKNVLKASKSSVERTPSTKLTAQSSLLLKQYSLNSLANSVKRLSDTKDIGKLLYGDEDDDESPRTEPTTKQKASSQPAPPKIAPKIATTPSSTSSNTTLKVPKTRLAHLPSPPKRDRSLSMLKITSKTTFKMPKLRGQTEAPKKERDE